LRNATLEAKGGAMSDDLRPHDAALERLKTLHPQLLDLSLDRTLRLLAALGRPQDRLPPVIHVAGTNGKGSTVAFLRAIAEAAGMTVHVITSPHLVRFAERIRVAGTLIDEMALAEILERVEAANAGQPITFFEITTVAALLAFAETPADLCLIEVGLGGRFDATNVIDRPAVSVITPVDYDHQDFLGSELSRIAWEKAGIVKAGRPVVVAHQNAEAALVIEAEAEKFGAPLVCAGRDFDAFGQAGRLVFQDGARLIDLPPPNLFGHHQFGNAGVAIAAALALKDPRIDEAALAEGISHAIWPARMQRLVAGPLAEKAAARGADLWLDGGHNPHAARALADVAAGLAARDGRPLTLIVGLLKRKDARGVFRAFADLHARIVVTGFEADAAAPPEDLVVAAREEGLQVEVAETVAQAVDIALAAEGPPPHLLICGSLYLAGEVLAMSEETWPR
jgi:dihydrofolate synthase/folylpolyglutamate synthase